MASYVTPRKNTAFVFYVALEDQANAGLFKTAPTLAAGDFKVSIDGGALANLTDLPTVTPSGGRMVKVALTASEMDGDNITVVASDASGAEWYDLVVNIQTSAQQVDDLATAAALATVDGIVDALALVAPDNKPTVAITGEASANVTLWNDAAAPDLDGLDGLDGSALATAAALAAVGANVDAVKAKTDLITTGGSVTVAAPVGASGDVTVYQGDDYANTDGRALDWSGTTWPDLTAATIIFMVRAQTGVLFSKAGSVVSAGGTTQTVRVELTDEETVLLEAWPAESELRIRATLASGGKATLVDSVLSVIEDIA